MSCEPGILVLLLVNFDFLLGSIQTGYHFNPGRNADWQIPVSDMLKHEKDPESEWVFNFRKYGNCVRANVNPFKLPRKFTICLKKFHDFAESMNFINFVGFGHFPSKTTFYPI